MNVRYVFPTWAQCDHSPENIHNVIGESVLVTIWEYCKCFIDVSTAGSVAHNERTWLSTF